MAEMIDGIKDAAPTALIVAAIGAGAAVFMDRPKKALTFGLVGAGVGVFAHYVFGLNLGKKPHAAGIAIPSYRPQRARGQSEYMWHGRPTSFGYVAPGPIQSPSRFGYRSAGESVVGGGGFAGLPYHGGTKQGAGSFGYTLPTLSQLPSFDFRGAGEFQTGQGLAERSSRMMPHGLAYRGAAGSRMGGFRARGDYAVGDMDDDVVVVPEVVYEPAPVCPDGYAFDDWGNCVLIAQPVFVIESEILYLYPEIIVQYPELRLHPERLFTFRPELRERYAGMRSVSEIRSRYQQFHHQPPPARPKSAPPAAPPPARGAAATPPARGHGKPSKAAPTIQPTATTPAPAVPIAHPAPAAHAAMPPPAPPPHSGVPIASHAALPVPPSGPPALIPPPTAPAHATSGLLGDWYTPGWQYHFPPVAYEYDWYGPQEWWWTT